MSTWKDALPEQQKADIANLKKLFAVELLKNPEDPFAAANEVTNHNTSLSLTMSTEWVNDKEVLEYKKGFLEKQGEEAFLASKAKVAKNFYDMGVDTTNTVDERIRALKSFAEIMGYVSKEGNNVNIQMNHQNVMVVKDHGSDEEWERKTAEQQRKLMDGHASPAE